MKLRHKLSLGFVFAGILPALLVAGLHTVSYLKNSKVTTETYDDYLIQNTTGALDALIQNAVRDIRAFVVPSLLQAGREQVLARQLAAYTYAYPYFSEILWVSPDGSILASSDATHQGLALTRFYPEIDDNLAEVLTRPAGIVSISDFDDITPALRADIEAGQVRQGRLTLPLLLRVDTERGKAWGVLVAVMSNQPFIVELQDLQQRLPAAGPVLLVNRSGEIMLSSEPNSVPLALHPLAERMIQKLSALTDSSSHLHSEIDGKDWDFVLSKTNGIGLSHNTVWYLLSSHAEDRLWTPIRHTLYKTLYILAAIISAGGIFSLWLARSLVRPVEDLSAAVARIGHGDLTARAPSLGNDEIGGLGLAFNTMAQTIELERGELEQKVIELVQAEAAVRRLNEDLENKVVARTADLEQAKLKVEQASRGKDEFLAAISHELRTPLNHILGFSELLKEGLVGELNDEQKVLAQDIYAAGSRQLAIINSLIELARLQAGKKELQLAPEDLNSLLDRIAVQHVAAARAADLDFTVDAAHDLGEMLLDRKVVTRLLDQLLINAFKFTPAGGTVSLRARRVPRIEVAASVRCDADHYLELAVADNGPGIAPDILPRLFSPFVQGDGNRNRSHQGTGVGLALVRLLAELHGGGCAVQSDFGAGATFLVWLPCGAVAVSSSSITALDRVY